MQVGPEHGDLDKASDDLAEELREKYEKRVEINDRMREGLTSDGKRLRRNAFCPCGSGRKFKKCCLHPMKTKLNHKLRGTRPQDDTPSESPDEN